MSSTLAFYGAFTTGGSAATGLTVTIDVTRITRSDGTQTTSVDGGSCTEITTPHADGVYLYRLTGADLTLYDYQATMKTSGTCDLNRIPAVYTPQAADLISILETALSETSGGLIAAAFKKFFDKASPTGTINSIPDAVAGASGGILISGTNTGTTTLGALTVSGATTLTGVTTATNASNDIRGVTVTGFTFNAATLATFFTTDTTKTFTDAVAGSVVYEIRQGVTTGPGVVINDDTSGKTIDSQATGAVDVDEIFARTDVRVLADLCSDTGSRLGSPTDTSLMKTALRASSVFTAICDDAMGIVELAAQVGKRYTAADIAALLASGTVNAAGLYRILSRLVVVLAFERRPDMQLKLPWIYEEAADMIQKLRDGERVLGFVEVAEAGAPSSRVETAQDVEARSLSSFQMSRLLGRRSDRNDPRRQ